MNGAPLPHVVVIAPNMDGYDVGEVATSFQLVKHMIALGAVRMTVLTLHRDGRVPLAEQLPGATVVMWNEPTWLKKFERFNAMAKPGVLWFYRKVRGWLRDELRCGRPIDLVHQMLPRAPRYASPLPGLGLRYIIGPVGGAIPTPAAFSDDVKESWFTRLRAFDSIRFKYDPALRRGFAAADLVFGVAPYMSGILGSLKIRRFEPFLGIGIEDLPEHHERHYRENELKMLFVGRAVRTKGLIEAIGSLAFLSDLDKVTLTVVGDGSEIGPARALAASLGVAGRVTFLGALPRQEIEAYYRNCDVLMFPSFRESMGGVIYEAMRWGMPVITVDYGGPGYIVDDHSGIRVALSTPEQMPRDLATAARALAEDPVLARKLSEGARQKALTEALWSAKAQKMIRVYQSLLNSPDATTAGGSN